MVKRILISIIVFVGFASVCQSAGAAPIINQPIQIATGSNVACALMQDGTVYCWGVKIGEPYIGPFPQITITPTKVPNLIATQISAGQGTVCAVLRDGTVDCWGNSITGTGSLATNIPTPLKGFTDIVQVSVSGGICGVTRSGTVICAGSNIYGFLGNGATSMVQEVGLVPGITNAIQVVANSSPCALLATGNVYCWGYNMDGGVGTGSLSILPTTSPSLVKGLPGVTQIGLGAPAYSICAVTVVGSIYCWGGGVGSPQLVQSKSTFSQVAVGLVTACGVQVGGTLACWAAGSSGSLQYGLTNVENVSGISGVSTVAVGAQFICALLQTHAIDCWGTNNSGVLGSTLPSVPNPSPIPMPIVVIDNPGVPSDLKFSASVTTMTATWSEPTSTGNSPITSYTVSLSDGINNFVCTTSSTSCGFTGLTGNTAYVGQVLATNYVGSSAPSLSITQKTATVPGPPTNLKVQASYVGTLIATWSPPADDGGSPITSYTLSATPSAGKAVGCAKINATSCQLSTLPNSTKYSVSVIAENLAGPSTPSPAVSATTLTPVVVVKTTTITCTKGKLTKKVTSLKPVCPSGYKKK